MDQATRPIDHRFLTSPNELTKNCLLPALYCRPLQQLLKVQSTSGIDLGFRGDLAQPKHKSIWPGLEEFQAAGIVSQGSR
jgi:hypothetical protein